jgi:hypothetical protein
MSSGKSDGSSSVFEEALLLLWSGAGVQPPGLRLRPVPEALAPALSSTAQVTISFFKEVAVLGWRESSLP